MHISLSLFLKASLQLLESTVLISHADREGVVCQNLEVLGVTIPLLVSRVLNRLLVRVPIKEAI